MDAPRTGADPVFLVNDRSGGQAGGAVGRALASRVGRERVHYVGDTDPEAFVARYRGGSAPLVAAGGDGTAVSLLEAATAQAESTGEEPVPVGILPLGTGNDLATTLGWPVDRGHHGRLDWALEGLREHRIAGIDRWIVEGPGFRRGWYNYCSWGCDARVARHFEAMRDHQRWLFFSRVLNKVFYGILGLVEVGAPLPIRLDGGDGVPGWARALVAANIGYYAGGGRLRGVRPDDGRADLLAFGSGVLMGLGSRSIRPPRRLGRDRGYTIHLARRTPMQIDGEAMMARPGTWTIRWGGRALVAVYPGSSLAVAEGDGSSRAAPSIGSWA